MKMALKNYEMIDWVELWVLSRDVGLCTLFGDTFYPYLLCTSRNKEGLRTHAVLVIAYALVTPFTLTRYVLYSRNIRVPAHRYLHTCSLLSNSYTHFGWISHVICHTTLSAHCPSSARCTCPSSARCTLQYPYMLGTSQNNKIQNSSVASGHLFPSTQRHKGGTKVKKR